ncbi:UNVERIFIED_CONTAM: hypothetical protein GTU68_067031 [Idotea baltica]|nr:hypothetical protein [Idotea baltica]
MGASGSGKSTLLNLLGALDKPDEGHIELAGKDLSNVTEAQAASIRNHHLGFVFQFHHLLPEFNAIENLAMPLLLRGEKKKQAFEQAQNLLADLRLEKRGSHKPAELSGGERQRVAIARALIGRPDVLLMDEPTGNLDSENASRVLDLIQKLNEDYGVALLLVTHDPLIAARLGRSLKLKDGVLKETGMA